VSDAKIFVTQPSLPPLDELIPYLRTIWERKILTNGGPFHEELEGALCRYLGVEHLSLFSNATIALIAAPSVMGIAGEVVTTPYSFVATTHALRWNGLVPVFADVHADTLNLDPEKIEAAITPKTSAIMPVHCYGHACDIEAIEDIARRHDLKVIYDAAHAFGVEYQGQSILRRGDLSILSFHATKVFNTFEGGAIIAQDAAMKQRIDQWKNFGIVDETTVATCGMNGKMSEFNAALGLLQLEYVDQHLARRNAIDAMYRRGLASFAGIRTLPRDVESSANCSYFPILIGDEFGIARDELLLELRRHGVYPRRYFFPLISELPMYRDLPSAQSGNLPVATDAARRVLCLPLYPTLSDAEITRIVEIIGSARKP
jgi:dTDP-4-amino-4,6-dideoxygalactose transaminase